MWTTTPHATRATLLNLPLDPALSSPLLATVLGDDSWMILAGGAKVGSVFNFSPITIFYHIRGGPIEVSRVGFLTFIGS